MKTLVIAVCAVIGLAAPSFAQSKATPVSTDQDAGGGKASGKGGKMKEAMQACRSQVKDKGLKGKEMRHAITDCVVKDHPGMANVMKCRMEGMDKGMKRGDELKSYVKDCMKKSG